MTPDRFKGISDARSDTYSLGLTLFFFNDTATTEIYTEPKYDPFWFCSPPPNWENIACVKPPGDIRNTVAPSVGMIVHVDFDKNLGFYLSTCTVTLVSPDTVITAGHCMASPIDDATSSSVTFDDRDDCNGTRPAGYNARFYKVQEGLRHRYPHPSANHYCLLLPPPPPSPPA